MQEQKGKCKDDIKRYFLDRFEQVEQSKTKQRNFVKKIRRSVVSEFVKTCDELDLSNAKSECLGLSTSTNPQGYCLPRTLRPEIKEI